MKLTHEQKTELFEKGNVIIPGVVPKLMVDETQRAINHSLGESYSPDHRKLASYCPDINRTPIISDVFNKTPALSLAESLIGKGNILPITSGQIALRFPTMEDRIGGFGGHLDGLNSRHEGIIHNFTVLAGMILSDTPKMYAGNFTVWPGTHHRFEQYFQEHGADILFEGTPKIDLPEPVQITGEAGDLILTHYQLMHGPAPNVSNHIRYALYFRLEHVDVKKDWRAPLTNIWLHFPGMRDIVKA